MPVPHLRVFAALTLKTSNARPHADMKSRLMPPAGGVRLVLNTPVSIYCCIVFGLLKELRSFQVPKNKAHQ